MMRAPAVVVATLLLSPYIFCQDQATAPPPTASAAVRRVRPAPSAAIEQKFALPGGVSLEVKNDEMTDRRVCSLTTPLWGIYASFNGSQAALFTSGDFDVDYSQKALLRIGDGEPFALDVPHDPNAMLIPKAHTADFVGALYARERIRVRFNRWPGSYEDNVELAIGDFAAGYNFGVELCGWPKPTIARPPFAPKPKISRFPGGGIDAEFGGSDGWMVSVLGMETSRSCSARGGASSIELINVYGHSDEVMLLGPTYFYTARAKLVAKFEPGADGKVSSGALIAAAYAAGDDGMVETFGHRHSLFGFREAANFIEQSCGVSWH